MSDRFNGQIWIGGEISRTKCHQDDPETPILCKLMSEINASGGSHEWGDAQADIADEAGIAQYIHDDLGVINLKHDQARNGEFEELEDFCRENDIPYCRVSDSYCEYQAEEVWWLPGMATFEQRYLDADEKHIITAESLQPIKALLEAALSNILSAAGNTAAGKVQVRSALAKINELDRFPPKLPTFKVIE